MGCCDTDIQASPAPAYRRVLWAVLLINAVMFVVEAASGVLADSRALQADALDFLGDTATYGLTLWALGQSMAWRLRAARIKGFSLLIMGVVVLANSIWALWQGSAPQGEMMMGVAGLALVVMLTRLEVALALHQRQTHKRLDTRHQYFAGLLDVLVVQRWGFAHGQPPIVLVCAAHGGEEYLNKLSVYV